MTSPIGVGLFGAMHHSKHKFAVVQHLVVKITTIIGIKGVIDSKKPCNSLNIMGLFENYWRRRDLYLDPPNKSTNTHQSFYLYRLKSNPTPI